jgi:hypothetical protein
MHDAHMVFSDRRRGHSLLPILAQSALCSVCDVKSDAHTSALACQRVRFPFGAQRPTTGRWRRCSDGELVLDLQQRRPQWRREQWRFEWGRRKCQQQWRRRKRQQQWFERDRCSTATAVLRRASRRHVLRRLPQCNVVYVLESIATRVCDGRPCSGSNQRWTQTRVAVLAGSKCSRGDGELRRYLSA